MTLLDILAPTYTQMLRAVSTWLDKAEAQGIEGGAEQLLSARLAPDMFPLSTQIRFACVQALEGMCRLSGDAYPPSHEMLLSEGRNAGEHPGSIADARRRLAETIAAVSEASDLPAIDPQSPVAHALPQGTVFDLTAEQFVRDWAIPQFYFHVMAGYAILRAQGIDLGKADYAAHMFAFLRPGTMQG